ncbi:MAG TPA: MGMT family protein [Gemmatimonadales bacterium]|nr:MGMT family protein [Gemmatimonadales bacterium]
MPGTGAGNYARIYAVVRRIPRGRVATYGQIAELAGLPGHARQVGYALHALPEGSTVPWHRVLNARGTLSLRRDSGAEISQRIRLEQEGIRFDAGSRVALGRLQWRPARRKVPRRPRAVA